MNRKTKANKKESMSSSRKASGADQLERVVTNLFIVIFLSFITLEAWPAPMIGGPFVYDLQKRFDIFGDVTGFWQGEWTLFSPEPPNHNIYVTADLIYHLPNGTEHHEEWQSPQWYAISNLEKKRLFRRQQYFDKVRNDNNYVVWPPLAKYLASTNPIDVSTKETFVRVYPGRVRLWRRWNHIASPHSIKEWPRKIITGC